MKIEICKIENNDISRKDVLSWPVWTCKISEFEWEYSEQESCFLLEGEVEVSSDFETVNFGVGDYVIFPRGLKC